MPAYRRPAGALAALLLASAAGAQDVPSRIVVTGTGSVFTPPDVAVVAYQVRGEGATPDQAVQRLEDARRAIDGGTRALLEATSTGGQVAVSAVRGRECTENGYGPPQLDTGACAIIGHVATLSMEVRTRNVAKAATAVGLIARLGGVNPRLDRYDLADPRPAQRRAMAAALTDAKARAEAIAEGAGVRLGPILTASDGSAGERPVEIVVTAARLAPPPPPPPPAPIAVDVKPRPIETTASATVSYRITP